MRPIAANELRSMTEVALVGPRTMNFEPAKNIPTIDAIAEPIIPYRRGSPAMAA
mgnify:CR=1 FL=1